jgi:predicted enzyme related to lactoylglutathione lyase
MHAAFARARHDLRCLVLLLAVMCQPSFASPAALPPIGDSGHTEHHPGKVIWADLVTPDLAASMSFYTGLFGWTFQPIHTGTADYAVALLGGRPIAGLLQKPVPPTGQKQPAWLTFIAVRNVDDADRVAMRQGARVISEPRTYAGRGRQSVILDPDGAVFALLASSSGDPPDFLAAPGEWIWSSLLVPDPKQSAAFYKTIFGYDVFDLPSEDDKAHVILSTDDYARAGINPLPSTGTWHAHWLNFVRVASALDASAKAVSLGGRVLVQPHLDRHGGSVAVVADPSGAPIGLMEWSDTDSKVEPK